MGNKNRSSGREGRIVTSQVGDRWTAQLELDEVVGESVSRLRIDVSSFPILRSSLKNHFTLSCATSMISRVAR